MNNIIVTGGCGFIGKHFVKKCLNEYHVKNVINVDKLTYCADKSANQNHPRYQLIDKDVNYISTVPDPQFPIDYIFHFAAESHVDNSIRAPRSFIKSNVGGTFEILNFAKNNNIPIVVISTDEVYGSLGFDSKPSLETDELKPSSIYSSTKASADLIALSFFKTHGLDVRVTRCCNNYGEGQHSEKFIPTIFNNIKNNKNIPVYGSGKNTREWINVEDHCDAIWSVARFGSSGEVYNVGTGFEISNIDLVNKILKLWGKTKSKISFVEDRKGHDLRYRLNSLKIKAKTGWKPKISFEKGIKQLVKYYKQ